MCSSTQFMAASTPREGEREEREGGEVRKGEKEGEWGGGGGMWNSAVFIWDTALLAHTLVVGADDRLLAPFHVKPHRH